MHAHIIHMYYIGNFENRHLLIRDQAKQNMAKAAAKMKTSYNNAKKVKVVKLQIGDGVTVRIPRHDRGVCDMKRMPGVVVGKKQGTYKIRTEYGMLQRRYRTDELQKCAYLSVSSSGWENDPIITLRSAAKQFNRRKEDVSHCNCTSGCKNNRCRCFKRGLECTTRCHSGKSCRNTVTGMCCILQLYNI